MNNLRQLVLLVEQLLSTTEVLSLNRTICNFHRTLFFKWAIPSFFLYFGLFNTVDTKQMSNINYADDWI